MVLPTLSPVTLLARLLIVQVSDAMKMQAGGLAPPSLICSSRCTAEL